MSTLHIRAVGDARCAFVDPDGKVVVGRYAGRDRRTHEALPGGEVVTGHTHYQRALSRGELVAFVPAPIAPAPTAKPTPAPKETAQ